MNSWMNTFDEYVTIFILLYYHPQLFILSFLSISEFRFVRNVCENMVFEIKITFTLLICVIICNLPYIAWAEYWLAMVIQGTGDGIYDSKFEVKF